MSLVGHWILSSASYHNGVFHDETDNNNDGTPANAPNFTANQQVRVARATVFDGSSDGVTLGDNFTGIIGHSDDYSMSCWLYWIQNDGTIINISPGAAAGNRNGINVVSGDLQAGYWNGVAYVGKKKASISPSTWYHAIMSNSSGTISLYIDKVSQATIGMSGLNQENEIGHNASYYFDGNICNVRFYNHVLTSAERTNIYDSEIFWDPVTISAEMDFSGALTAQNPNWLLIPDNLNWQGEWNELTSYDERDVVLYKTTDGEYHGYVSKQGHNAGNNPTTEYLWWSRLIQGEWER